MTKDERTTEEIIAGGMNQKQFLAKLYAIYPGGEAGFWKMANARKLREAGTVVRSYHDQQKEKHKKELAGVQQRREENYLAFREDLGLDKNVSDAEAEQLIAEFLHPRTLSEIQADTGGTRRPALIEGLLRQGETMNVIASPKVGKSWLVYNLAARASTGGELLGFQATRDLGVLLIDNELHQDELGFRVSKVFAEMEVDASADNFQAFSLRGRSVDIYALDRMFSSISMKGYDLVILDAFYRFLPEGISENDNAQMTQIYNELDRLAKKHSVAFVVIHHSSKGGQGEKSVTDTGAGAGSISRAADAHLVIREHLDSTEESGLFVLEAVTRSWKQPEPKTLEFTWPTWTERADLEPVVKSQAALKERDKRNKPSSDEVAFKCLDIIRGAQEEGIGRDELAEKVERASSWVSGKMKPFLIGDEPPIAQYKHGRKIRYYSTAIPRSEIVTQENLETCERLDQAFNLISQAPGQNLTKGELIERFDDLGVRMRTVTSLVKAMKDDPRFEVQKAGRETLIGIISPDQENLPGDSTEVIDQANPFDDRPDGSPGKPR